MHPDYPIYPLAMDKIMDKFWSPTNDGHELSRVNLCWGSSGFDVRRYIEIDALARELTNSFPYGETLGRLSLREQLCQLYADEYGVQLEPSRICITDGASGGLTVALIMLIAPGDEVILPEVYFPPYTVLIHMLGGRCVFAKMGADNTYDVESLRECITPRTRAILVNSPSNPHGAITSREKFEQIVSLGVPVVSDEVYHFLVGENRPCSLLQLSDQHYVTGSFSKCFALAGHRVGYLIVPEAKARLATDVKATLNLCTSIPSQILAEAALRNRKSLLVAHRLHLAQNREGFVAWAEREGIPLAAKVGPGFFALLNVERFMSPACGTLDLAMKLLDESNVAIAPGIDFANQDRGFFRVNIAASSDALEAGCTRLARFVKEHGEHGSAAAKDGTR